jgi:hypothetical protein
MSCDLANGRLEVCKDAVGGIETVYFINYGDFNPEVDVTYTAGTDTIATIANVTSLYKYELKGTNSFEQVVTSSRENGTTFVEQTLTMTLKKQDATTHKSVKLLSYGRPQIVVRNRNNQFFLMGLEQETLLANLLNCSTEAALTGSAGDVFGATTTIITA